MVESLSRRQVIRKPAVVSDGGIVVSQSRLAAQAGAAVLAAGGNAVDAAVVTAMAVGVAEPWMSGIGGGGLLLHRDAASGKVRAWDFGMRSPRNLNPADYPVEEGAADADLFGWPPVKEARNLRGGTAIAVPGQVAGMAAVLEELGSLSWKDALAPAILLAEKGVPLDWFSLLQISQHAGDLAHFPESAAVYLEQGQLPALQPQRCLSNPKLLETLKQLAAAGPRDFYEGALAQSIVSDVRAAGGSLSLEDLRDYQAREVRPLVVTHGDAKLHVLPELNGGPTLARAVEQLRETWAGGSPDGTFYLAAAQALRDAFAHRLEHLGDEDGRRGPSCTTHLSVVDRQGNVVTLTQTLLSVFGSKVTLPGSGILMNNGINWFDPRPGRPNSLAPGKRTLSNYVPVLGETPERIFGIGASGGRKIIPAMTQLGLMLASGMTLDEAMHQPRIDVTSPNMVTMDPRLDSSIRSALAEVHPTNEARAGFAPNNYATALAVLREGGRNQGAVDPLHPWAEAVAEEEVT